MTRSMGTTIALFAAGLLAIGCGDDGESAPAADAQRPVDAAPPVDALQCNDLVLAGPEVAEIYVAEDVPVPQGGAAIPDGTYHLIETRTYTGTSGATGPSGNVFKATIRVTDLVMDAIEQNNIGWEVPMSSTSELVIDGAYLNHHYTCPDWGDVRGGFDTEPGKLILYGTYQDLPWDAVYELQP